MLPLILFALTCLTMIVAVLRFPKLRLGRLTLDSYWVITTVGALLLLLCGPASPSEVAAELVADSAVNPVKILVLFLSMTMLSVFLDELGFFRYMAMAVLRRAHGGQRRLFFVLYLVVSVLTVFTSNDVIILSFTPFICYFAKNAGIDPMPYLAAEFVAANTFSMALSIGNPTNIYLSCAAGIDFLSYFRVMLVPTLLAGAVAPLILYALYRRALARPMTASSERGVIGDRLLLSVGLVHLSVCTVLLAVGSYLGLEMFAVSLFSALSLALWVGVISLLRRRAPRPLVAALRRVPWELIPFVLSMFVSILVLGRAGLTARAAALLAPLPPIPAYGITAFLGANLVNNIPMSVLFAGIHTAGEVGLSAVYATVIASNIGAYFTPIGALAGIMWSNILRRHGYRFSYAAFLRLGVTVAVPTLAAALFGLWLVV
ncbi:MAG: hypothetical protein J6T24_06600 [Clostridia bacterium]|nr:hypothetical protein [Clostridia bacterium]